MSFFEIYIFIIYLRNKCKYMFQVIYILGYKTNVLSKCTFIVFYKMSMKQNDNILACIFTTLIHENL